MRKYLIGGIVGALLAISTQSYGEEFVSSIIGKQVQGQFPIKINGVKLNQSAAVVDGTSYLPVRAVGEALNMDVSFNADLGIELKKKGGNSVVIEPEKTAPTLQEIEEKIEANKVKRRAIDTWIGIANENLKYTKDNPEQNKEIQKEMEKYQSMLKDNEAELQDLEKQKAELSK